MAVVGGYVILVIVISLDVLDPAEGVVVEDESENEPGRKAGYFKQQVLYLQNVANCLEAARFPVIAAIQGACVGGALDLITACDIRLASKEAFFCIQEINIGMAADVGTLQRLPRIFPDSKIRELAYTGRRMYADEAKDSGLVSDIYESQEEMLEAATKMAKEIASKSPVAIYGLKAIINYSREDSLSDSLDFNALWSGAMLSQKDMTEAMSANMEKRDAAFTKMADVKNFDETGD